MWGSPSVFSFPHYINWQFKTRFLGLNNLNLSWRMQSKGSIVKYLVFTNQRFLSNVSLCHIYLTAEFSFQLLSSFLIKYWLKRRRDEKRDPNNNITIFFLSPCLLQSFSSGIPPVKNSLLVGQDESSLASSNAGLTVAVILIKYLDEEYLFLCNIYNAVNRIHNSATSTLHYYSV